MSDSPKTGSGAGVGADGLGDRPSVARGGGRAARRAALCGAGAVLCSLLAACDEPTSAVRELGEARAHQRVGREVRWGASSAERFGLSAENMAPGGGQAPSAGMEAAPSLHYTVPEGWVELEPAPFREVNLRVAGNERAECYLTTLIGGGGGGLAPNVNRWRQQVGQAPLSEAEIAELPRLTWFGKPAVFVDFAGTWQGMSGAEAEPDWRLVGALQVEASQARFLKMTGPSALIGEQIEAFKALLASFHEDRDGHSHAAPGAGPTDAPGATGAGSSGASGGAGGTQGTGGAPGTAGTGPLRWIAPPGWVQGPPKPMRDVTFLSGSGGVVDCSVTVLPGEAGGLLANLNRWCGQLGQKAFTEAEVERLPRAPMLGTSAVLVELERGPGATADPVQEYLLGAVCLLPTRSVFVKLTGPRAEVEAQRGAFVDFCRSLQAEK